MLYTEPIHIIKKNIGTEAYYIKKYEEELHIVFGNFRYEYIGTAHDPGYYGFGEHDYNRWKIYFNDPYGNEKNVTLTDNLYFESQIRSIYMDVIERYLISDVLSQYFDGEYYSYQDDVYDINTITENTSNNYYLKKYDYYITDSYFALDFNLGVNDNMNSNKIQDYNLLNLTNTNIRELINNGTVKIHSLTYQPKKDNKEALNDFDKENLINYLSNLTSEINNIIEVGFAKYYVHENIVTYKGEETVSAQQYDLEFNN